MVSQQKRSFYGSSAQVHRVWAAYAAFIWVVVFIVFHIYWAYGGHLGFGDAHHPLPPLPTNGVEWTYTCIVSALFIGGTLVPLAIAQTWGRFIPSWLLLPACWFGFVILTLRALASYVDDLVRFTDLLPNGITGLTYAQIFGDNHVTTFMLWSSAAIDAYFLLGGVLYGLTAWHNRHR